MKRTKLMGERTWEDVAKDTCNDSVIYGTGCTSCQYSNGKSGKLCVCLHPLNPRNVEVKK